MDVTTVRQARPIGSIWSQAGFFFPCLLVSSSFSSEVYQMSFTLATYVIVFFTVPLSF